MVWATRCAEQQNGYTLAHFRTGTQKNTHAGSAAQTGNARGGLTEGRGGFVVAHVHLVDPREAAEVRTVGVVEIESLTSLRHEGRRILRLEVPRVLRPADSNTHMVHTGSKCPWRMAGEEAGSPANQPSALEAA
jgi:hypothetical protein